MFDAPNYQRLGLWATPDYWKTSANNPIWAIIGVKCRNEWEMETGQMFIDKQRHLDAFLLIQYMLERHDKVSTSAQRETLPSLAKQNCTALEGGLLYASAGTR